MPHIHKAIDLTVAAFVVHNEKVIMVHHKKLGRWVPPGGHVELDQNPEEALFNELYEETGLSKNDVQVYSNKPTVISPETTFLYAPTFLDVHDITTTHKHIGMIYILRSLTDRLTLSKTEHHDIRWFSKEDLENPNYRISEAIKFYAREACKQVTNLG